MPPHRTRRCRASGRVCGLTFEGGARRRAIVSIAANVISAGICNMTGGQFTTVCPPAGATDVQVSLSEAGTLWLGTSERVATRPIAARMAAAMNATWKPLTSAFRASAAPAGEVLPK